MPYDSRVYRVLIASPSDVDEERDIATRVIQEWNNLHSYDKKIVLLPLRWETHTAPAYNTRPQDVINKAIVDNCDLLVGIFWTRLGTSTGEADSGTLEEIDRAGKDGKQIMLYFSKIGADPGKLDLDQVKKLNDFKSVSYNNGLVESYKSHIDFRDKFVAHLQMKVSELQQADTTSPPPLSLELLSTADGTPINTSEPLGLTRINILDANDIIARYGTTPELKEMATSIFARHSFLRSVKGLAFSLRNHGTTCIHNAYITMSLTSTQRNIAITEKSPLPDIRDPSLSDSNRFFSLFSTHKPEIGSWTYAVQQLQDTGLVCRGDGWTLTNEQRTIPPRGHRVIRPQVHLLATGPDTLRVNATVYSDSLSSPLELETSLDVNVDNIDVALGELDPDIEAFLKARSELDPDMLRKVIT